MFLLTCLVCGVGATSNVIVWGYNDFGQCNVPHGLNATDIACGGYHTLVIDTDGYVHAWGRNDYGQCDVPAGLQATHVAGGGLHSLAIDTAGMYMRGGLTYTAKATYQPACKPLQ